MTYSVRNLAMATAFAMISGGASAALVQTLGPGSAVTTVNASADFEDPASLGVAYAEGGMTFTRVGISTNNNTCGFAGCPGNFAAYGFVGNYFYGADDTNVYPESYIQIDVNGGQNLGAIEFLFGWGPLAHAFYWEAFDNSVLVGSGNGSAGPGSVLGISGGAFDRIRFTDSAFAASINSLAQGVSPGIDSVRAQYAVPESGTVALLALGLAGLVLSRSKRPGAGSSRHF